MRAAALSTSQPRFPQNSCHDTRTAGGRKRQKDGHTGTHLLTDEGERRRNKRTLNAVASNRVSRLVGTLMNGSADRGPLYESTTANRGSVRLRAPAKLSAAIRLSATHPLLRLQGRGALPAANCSHDGDSDPALTRMCLASCPCEKSSPCSDGSHHKVGACRHAETQQQRLNVLNQRDPRKRCALRSSCPILPE